MSRELQEEILKRTVHVGNVPSSVDKETILTLFQPYGRLEDVRTAGVVDHNRRYWFVQFADKSDAEQALGMDGMLVHDARIRVSFARMSKAKHSFPSAPFHPSDPGRPMMRLSRSTDREKIARTVFVEGIESEYTALEIAKFFSYCGTVTAVRRSPMRGNASRNRVWVEFMTPEQAYTAITCNGQCFDQFSMSIQQSQTAICTNELMEAVAFVQETGVYHEVQKRSLYNEFDGSFCSGVAHVDGERPVAEPQLNILAWKRERL